MDVGIQAVAVAVFLVPIGAAVAFSVVRHRRRKAALDRLAAVAGAKGGGNSGAGAVDGTPFSYRFDPGSKNRPPELKVSVASFSPLQVSLRRERVFDLGPLASL